MDENTPEPQSTVFDIDEHLSEVTDDVRSLITVGYVEQTYHFGGHSFLLATPKHAAEIAVMQIISEYDGAMAQGKALQAAQIAAALKLVDGRELYVPLAKDESPAIYVRKQFHEISNNWHEPLIEVVHDFWRDLKMRQAEAVADLTSKS